MRSSSRDCSWGTCSSSSYTQKICTQQSSTGTFTRTVLNRNSPQPEQSATGTVRNRNSPQPEQSSTYTRSPVVGLWWVLWVSGYQEDERFLRRFVVVLEDVLVVEVVPSCILHGCCPRVTGDSSSLQYIYSSHKTSHTLNKSYIQELSL